MNRSFKSAFLILFIASAVFLLTFANSQALQAGEGQYVMVTLKDKTEVKFEYDSFVFNWVTTQIREEVTCKTHDFAIDEINEIYVLNKTLDACNQKEDQWVFDLYLQDKKPIQGFLELKAEEVTGIVFGTETQRTISYSYISKVSYH